MAGFDDILQNLHGGVTVQDDDQYIIVESNRTITVPQDYDTLLGYVGDVNSQVVAFQLPLKHKGHQLSECSYKRIKWKNLNNDTEGQTDLIVKEKNTGADTWVAYWEIPSELMTSAGTIEIGISIYDVNEDNKIIFAWNTATYKGFTIGESFIEVGEEWSDKEEGKIPAKNEILNVNVENRNIIAPVNYNSIIANYGDIGTSKVFFVINRIIRGMNVLDDTVKVNINYSLGGTITQGSETVTAKTLFVTDTDRKSDKLLLTWNVPEKITRNEGNYIGTIVISVEVYQEKEGVVNKRWITSNFDKLQLGSSLRQEDVVNLAERNEQIVREIVDEQIDNYIDNTYFVTTDQG